MSICDGSEQLLESYGFYRTNESQLNGSVDFNSVFKHWCYYDSVPTIAHFAVGILLIFICTLSIIGNLLVIIVFSRYRRLQSPANTLILNLAVSDMLNGCLHPMAIYSSFKEHWEFERFGCEMYAALCGLFGLVSIVTLTAIAIERCMVIAVKPWYGGVLFTQVKAKVSCIIIWIYCFAVMLPPWFGWGAFVPEGFLTSCSFDYITRTSSNRSYFIYIFTLGFFFPVGIISVCYIFIIKTIFQNEKDMKKNNVKKTHSKPKKRNDYKAAEMIMFVIGMFLISWTPYSLVAFIGQFGNMSILTPWISVLPSLFAKMSTIYNPAIYGLSHRHFRATLRRIFKKEQRCSADRGGTYYTKNSNVYRAKNSCLCLPNVSDILDESSSSCTGKKLCVGVAANNVETNRILYVKQSNESYQCHISYKVDKIDTSYEKSKSRTNSKEEHRGKHGQAVILYTKYDAEKLKLIRSLMFKSESSIYQKYQTYLENDHIVKLPSALCSYSFNTRPTQNAEIPFPRDDLPNKIPKTCVRVLKMEAIPVDNLGANVLKFSHPHPDK